MNKVILWSISFLIVVFFAIKIYFISLETNYALSNIAKIDILILVSAFLLSIYFFFRETLIVGHISKRQSFKFKHLVNIVLILLITIILGISFTFNLNKKSLDWDAVALYDSRAKILQSGVHFSEMTKLSEFDDKNKYYYLLYPPFTSIAHFAWYSSGINLPVGVIYSVALLVMAFILGFLIYDHFGLVWSIVTVFLIVSNENIFSISLIEYTNLPFTLYMSIGIMSILSGMKRSEKYLELLGYILVAATVWIRYLEPVWICVVFSMFIYSILTKTLRKNIFMLVAGTLILISQYLSWGYFEKMIANNPTIFNVSPRIIFESIAGLFTGTFLSIFVYYIKSYGIIAVVYFVSLIKINKNEPKEYLFIRLFISSCLLMYLAGIYGISFMFDWWREMSGSLVRSSSYLVPISIFLLVSNIKYLLENIRSSSETITLKEIRRLFRNVKK